MPEVNSVVLAFFRDLLVFNSFCYLLSYQILKYLVVWIDLADVSNVIKVLRETILFQF